jgi:carboxynorspermidine decarboxylase
MVKKSWFNGIAMPSIAIRRVNGSIDVVRQFTFHDYEASLS